MLKVIASRAVIMTIFYGTLSLSAQQVPPGATMQQKDGMFLLHSSDPRPLLPLSRAIAEQHGWIIDYEDPIYAGSDLVDDTDPKWRAAHPNSKGVTKPSGKVFSTSVVDNSSQSLVDDSTVNLSLLASITDAYNNSGQGPGRFTVRRHGDRLVVVGANELSGSGLLDANVEVSCQDTASVCLSKVFSEVFKARGMHVAIGWATYNLMQQRVHLDGGRNTAREYIDAVFDELPAFVAYDMLYDADAQMFLFNINPVTQTFVSATGERVVHEVHKQRNN